MWRVCLELKLDITVVDRTWTLEQILDQNEALDVWDDAQHVDELMPPDLERGDRLILMREQLERQKPRGGRR